MAIDIVNARVTRYDTATVLKNQRTIIGEELAAGVAALTEREVHEASFAKVVKRIEREASHGDARISGMSMLECADEPGKARLVIHLASGYALVLPARAY
jgi:hypothetical protein